MEERFAGDDQIRHEELSLFLTLFLVRTELNFGQIIYLQSTLSLIFLMSDLNVPLLVLVGAAIGYIAAGGQGWPTDQSATLAVRRTHREKWILFVLG